MAESSTPTESQNQAQFDAKSLPTDSAISSAASLSIFDKEGNKVNFGSLFEKKAAVVIFIRHFFCGSCQMYVEHVAKVPASNLEQAGVQIVVVGCGDWKAIPMYHETTGFTGPIYADPNRDLYFALGMTLQNLEMTPKGQPRPSYLANVPVVQNVLQSTWRALKHVGLVGKQGNISQLGGEFVFGPGQKCDFASRMRHTEDHVSVVELMKHAGVEYTENSQST
ncbi:hypothetical protein CC1G_11406 [Coprinopsis cinerea okayama7|uniref:Thioredoxin domain-containing protein n=1 Tax=Coprinopsis cinerea (strain Okayama-7 / 130 / ATCC MYA-4618 / FGSC 9003) TaxID=240176 RepID=A8N475_COPC7|nr:hypothetical protein CC1G_11406 [Coprinopsis cinerea okayama7\|eukprot:XP_001829670.2 hypothetical protein CC1G_11406 [Coprinopsis cinerea okayama7\